MTSPTQPRFRLYALALRLYPAAFRARYADEMLDAARHEYAHSPNPLRFTASLAADTLRSLFREHLRAATPTRPGYVAAFALFFTFLLLAVAVVHQQILRRDAGKFPTEIATFIVTPQANPRDEAWRVVYISRLKPTHDRAELSSPRFLKHDLGWAVFYDASGHPISGDVTHNGTLPQLPQGLFNAIRAHGEDKLIWQPQPGVRYALTGLPLPNGGFVVAGHTLIPTEARTASLDRLLRWIWAVAMLACCVLALSARKHTRQHAPTAPTQN
jgi:hypothetical protein